MNLFFLGDMMLHFHEIFLYHGKFHETEHDEQESFNFSLSSKQFSQT